MVFTGLWPGNGAMGARPGPAFGGGSVSADGGHAIRADGGSAVCADCGSAVCADGGIAVCADGDYIVCADGGYAICAAAGFRPAAVIGDFDSLSAELIDEIDALGVERVIYPSEKDDTDTMLCVKYGLERGFGRFLIIGGIGGDFGHTMANLQVLSFLTDMKCEAEIMTGRERVLMVGGEAAAPAPLVFTGRPGLRFSVLSYAERSSGVSIRNAKYELSDAALTHSCPLGVSNECVNTDPVTVSVRYGRLLVIIDI